MVVGLPLVLEGETSVRNVVQVLQPLEVGDCHTTGVDVHVRDDLCKKNEKLSLKLNFYVGGGVESGVKERNQWHNYCFFRKK